MSLLSRITDFTPGSVIQSQPFDDEFNQLVNALSGVSQNKSIRVISNDNSFAVARFDQRGTNHIIEGFADGGEVFRLEKDGDIVALGITGVAGVYTFTSIPVLPNSDPTLDNQAVRRKFVTDSMITKSITIGTEQDPNASPGVTESGRFSYFAPDGNTMVITKLKIKFQEGAHTGGNTVSYIVRIRDAAGGFVVDLGPISLDDTNNTLHATYTLDIADQALTAGHSVTYYKSNITGAPTERAISIGFVMTEKRL